MNYSLQKLIAAFPRMRVFLMTPSWMPTFDDKDSDKYPNGIGCFLREYVDAMLRVAELNLAGGHSSLIG